MPERHADWLRQAKRDLEHARRAADAGDWEWSCFAAQQAAEKAVKALYQSLGAAAWGHSVTMLLTNLPETHTPHEALVDQAKELDKHYIPTRYPNGFDSGAPMDYYTHAEAERSITNAHFIIRFCEDSLAQSGGNDKETRKDSHSNESQPSGD
ncbi:MAG: HEPN domain-containing protein [Dissulfuribacterales bacterium]